MSTVTTPTELRLAKRMARLGTETAFEMLAGPRAGGPGQEHHSPGNRRARFRHPGQRRRGRYRCPAQGLHPLRPSAGFPELRQAIADEVTASRGVKVTADEVVVVPGGKPIIFFTMLALVEEGDEVIYPNPGFPIYESMINFLGAKAVPIADARRSAISVSTSTNWRT